MTICIIISFSQASPGEWNTARVLYIYVFSVFVLCLLPLCIALFTLTLQFMSEQRARIILYGREQQWAGKMISPEGAVTILFCAFARRSYCVLVSSVFHARICCRSLSFCLKQTPVTDMTAILVSSLTAGAALQTSVWMRWWWCSRLLGCLF